MKRFVSVALASIMAISVMSSSAFAMTPLRYVPGPDAVSTSETRSGVLPNGLRYEVVPMTEEEIEAMCSGISAHSYSWSGKVSVPISNTDGTNGAQLGKDFIIAPDATAEIYVAGLPSTMPTVNIGAAATNGMWNDWVPNVGSYTKVILSPEEGYTVYSYRVTVSTSEENSRIASFSIETY